MVIKMCYKLFFPLSDIIVHDNLVVFQTVKNFFDFKQSGVKITVITNKSIHQSLCRVSLIQFTYTMCYASSWYYSPPLVFPAGPLSLKISHQDTVWFSHMSHACCIFCPSSQP